MNMTNVNPWGAGFSLIEVLVSVLVLSVGLLGIAGLQLNMIKFNHSAHMRATAIAQANNMIDRMRANYAGVSSGVYNNVTGIPSLPACSSCSVSEIALRDTHQWNSTNASLLPSGQGVVTGNSHRFTITMRWDNERTGASGTACSGNAKVDLTCLTVEVEL